MTPRQAQLLSFLKGYIEQHGYSPTYREMSAHMRLKSKSGVIRMLRSLEKESLISFGNAGARAVTVVDPETTNNPALKKICGVMDEYHAGRETWKRTLNQIADIVSEARR